MKKQEKFGIGYEPALGHGAIPQICSYVESACDPPDDATELEKARDSVAGEPALGAESDSNQTLRDFLTAQEKNTTPLGRFLLTCLAGTLGGLFSIPAVFLAGAPTYFLYPVLVAPVIEEILKQLGMIVLLERKPWVVTSRYQFILCGLLGGGIFATLENLIYGNLYLAGMTTEEKARVMAFRWVVCTAMHVACSQVSSMGLYSAWRKAKREGRIFRLHDAFFLFAIAMGIHGIYNASAFFFDRFFR